MFEVQINDNYSLYNTLKSYSIKSFDRTNVLLMKDSMRSKIPAEYSINEIQSEEPISVDYNGKVFNFESLTDSLRCYLGMYLPWNNEVPVRQTEQIYELINNDIITTEVGFNSNFFPLGRNAKISDLVCYRNRITMNRRKIDLTPYKDLLLRDVFYNVSKKIKECSSCEMSITVINTGYTTKNIFFIDVTANYEDENGEIKDIQFTEYNPNQNVKNLLKEGNKINVLKTPDNKIQGFLPLDMEVNNRIVVSPSKEAKKLLKGLNVATFRILYYEYLIRGGR